MSAFVIFVSLQSGAEALTCYLSYYSSLWHNGTRIVYCDPSFEECCSEGCCERSVNVDFSIWTISLLFFLLLSGVYLCYRKFYKTNVPADIPEENITVNSQPRPPEVSVFTVVNEPSRGNTRENNHPVTPPPSYESIMSAPQFPPPSYGQVRNVQHNNK